MRCKASWQTGAWTSVVLWCSERLFMLFKACPLGFTQTCSVWGSELKREARSDSYFIQSVDQSCVTSAVDNTVLRPLLHQRISSCHSKDRSYLFRSSPLPPFNLATTAKNWFWHKQNMFMQLIQWGNGISDVQNCEHWWTAAACKPLNAVTGKLPCSV